MNRLTITAGTGFTRDGDTLSPARRDEALALIRARLAADWGGYTETDGMGGWVNPDGKLIVEPCIIWTLYGDAARVEARADETADFIRLALRQHTVVVDVAAAAIAFVGEPETA